MLTPCPRPHDLSLPDWGPYSRHCAAIVHIPDLASGRTMELAIAAGAYRGRLSMPSQRYDSDWAPLAASPDLGHWSHRLEIGGDPQLVCDVACDRIDGEDHRLVTATLRNAGGEPAAIALHLLAACRYPQSAGASHALSDAPLRPDAFAGAPPAAWIDARDYAERRPGRPGPRDGLAYDGWARGEVRADRLIDGGGVAVADGDVLTWAVPAGRRWLRWMGAGPLRLEVAGRGIAAEADGGPAWIDLGEGSGPLRMTVVAAGAETALDGIAVAERAPATAPWSPRMRPERLPAPTADGMLLRWPDLPGAYGLAWDRPAAQVREVLSERLDELLRAKAQDHVSEVIAGDGQGHWTDAVFQPIAVPPGGAVALRCAIVHAADPGAAGVRLAAAIAAMPGHAARAAGAASWDPEPTPAGAVHRAAQRQMAATVLQNVAFPVYTRRRYIRHHTPGKTWDSLYTWDSGFIGLGLCELSPQRAADCLAAYLTGPGDPHCAFIHHGTPLPAQIQLAHQLFNRTQDLGLIRRLWPGLLAMHRFLVGRDPASRTARLGSGLLQTWAYFYNSGGWDDYPPQWHLYRNGGHDQVAPAVSSSHCARSALILAHIAGILGEAAAAAELRADHARLTGALDAHAWNEEEGVYSYVVHDAAGRPTGPLRHASGVDFNLGLDGVSPLVARAGDAVRRGRMIARIFDPARMWTPIGISTVDRTAPYFSPAGYWNGTVWMPHQWFLWRALLDLGRGDLAWRIAEAALGLWTREVAASRRCYEHFPIATGRGAGWHHFGGLSAPVLCWYAAYHLPGRISTGADALVLDQAWDGRRAAAAELSLDGEAGATATVIVCCDPAPGRRVRFAGAPAAWRERAPGAVEVDLPARARGRLEVEPG